MSYYNDNKLYQEISLTGSGISLYSKIMHNFMEKKFQTSDIFPKVLEIGSDQGQHRSFVKHQYISYIQCDLHLPIVATRDSRVKSVLGDIRKLPFKNNEFDRVIVTCVLHHLPDSELPIQEISRVTKLGGVVTILIPKDPSFLYRFIRSVLMFAKHRNVSKVLEYSKLHKQQHIGNHRAIIQSLKVNNCFAIEKRHKFPIPPFTFLYCFNLRRV